MLQGEKSGMVKCPGVIGWKTLMPIPGMDSVGKCPTFAWVGEGGVTNDGWNILMHYLYYNNRPKGLG